MRDSPAFREAVNYEKHRPRITEEGVIAGPYLFTLSFTCLYSSLTRPNPARRVRLAKMARDGRRVDRTYASLLSLLYRWDPRV